MRDVQAQSERAKVAKFVILRRSGDYARVLRELGGALFATEGQVDRYFNHANETCKKIYEQYRAGLTQSFPQVDWFEAEGQVDECFGRGFSEDAIAHQRERDIAWAVRYITVEIPNKRRERIQARVEEHIRFAPEREREALRRANIRQACTR